MNQHIDYYEDEHTHTIEVKQIYRGIQILEEINTEEYTQPMYSAYNIKWEHKNPEVIKELIDLHLKEEARILYNNHN